MRGTEGLDLTFEKMMVFGSVENMNRSYNSGGGGEIGGLKLSEWNDIPVELLLRILSLVDDQTVIVASGVCHGWRDAISWGLTHLSLSWCKRNMNNLALSLIPKFTKLHVLILRQDTPQLQDDAIDMIAAYCHDLRELDLSKSFRLTDRSLYALARGCPDLVKLNISGCTAFSDTALGYLTGVKSLAYGCPDLRALDLCGCLLITDESVVALANNCLQLRSLGLYYCQNITDRAMYSLAQRRANNRHEVWAQVKTRCEEEGLTNLNISQCTALTPPAVQAVCDSFPALHTCPGRHSLIISGCLNLTSVHCACAVQAHRATSAMPWAH
ncbi:F-box protein skp2a [Phtheirospermum japonicum]|uniref:F-box protein skp2a n=1 Tax=Phtheirospermum japonicum TaxID=374723 RepID=A0A830CVK7_9LAMI|nr:F-box protein skp2a [Phtheirospermum japonicum]